MERTGQTQRRDRCPRGHGPSATARRGRRRGVPIRATCEKPPRRQHDQPADEHEENPEPKQPTLAGAADSPTRARSARRIWTRFRQELDYPAKFSRPWRRCAERRSGSCSCPAWELKEAGIPEKQSDGVTPDPSSTRDPGERSRRERRRRAAISRARRRGLSRLVALLAAIGIATAVVISLAGGSGHPPHRVRRHPANRRALGGPSPCRRYSIPMTSTPQTGPAGSPRR